MDCMFDNHSFNEEITSPSEAKSCYEYFTSNLTSFRHELAEKGLSYDECEKAIRQCWLNLLKSCQRVGWTNSHLNDMARKYGKGVNKAIKEK